MGIIFRHEIYYHLMILPLVAFLIFSSNVRSFHISKSSSSLLLTNRFTSIYELSPTARSMGPIAIDKDTTEFLNHELSSNDVSHVKILPRVFFSKEELEAADKPNSIPRPDSFAAMFSHSAPYIARHRGSIIVIHIGGSVLKNKLTFDHIMEDISILHLLGMKIILVVGVRDRLDQRLQAIGESPPHFHAGIRITNALTMTHLKEEVGIARCEIESALSRGIRGSTAATINVVSGNAFYTAKPTGVRDGIDFQLTGQVRRIETKKILDRVDAGDIVLLTSLGHSLSGDVFNVPSDTVAAECAVKVCASKLVFYTDTGEGLVDIRYQNRPVQSLRLAQAKQLLQDWHIPCTWWKDAEEITTTTDSTTTPITTSTTTTTTTTTTTIPTAITSTTTTTAPVPSVPLLSVPLPDLHINNHLNTVLGDSREEISSSSSSEEEEVQKVTEVKEEVTKVKEEATKVTHVQVQEEVIKVTEVQQEVTEATKVPTCQEVTQEVTQVQKVTKDVSSCSSCSSTPTTASKNSFLCSSFKRLLARGVYALSGGVTRCHYLTPAGGVLLQELYTRDGAGMLLARDMYDSIRPARDTDLPGIQSLTKPFEDTGNLLPRTALQYHQSLPYSFVGIRDEVTGNTDSVTGNTDSVTGNTNSVTGTVTGNTNSVTGVTGSTSIGSTNTGNTGGHLWGCGMLTPYSPTEAEIACLVVHRAYQGAGLGDTLLTYLEHRAVLLGLKTLFVLSTRTMYWFEERGFVLSSPEALPPTRGYNPARGSKVYRKDVGTKRDVEAEELLWGCT